MLKISLLFKKNSNSIPETVTGGLLQKNVFPKVCKFHRKTSVLESLFNKVVGLQLY